MAAAPSQKGLDSNQLAGGVRRYRLVSDPEVYLRNRAFGAGHPRGHSLRYWHGRAHDLPIRYPGAEGQIPSGHPREHHLVVPGLFRAGFGLRPGFPENQGGIGRRPLRDQWRQDLDQLRPVRRLDFRSGANQQRGQEAGGHYLHSCGYEVRGHQGQSHHLHRQRTQPQRG